MPTGWLSPRVLLSLYPSLTSLFEVARMRVGASEKHPPHIIYVMLFGLRLGGSLLAGFGMAAAKSRSWIHMLIFASTLTVTLYALTDMEYPRLGLIRIEGFDHFLVDAHQQMQVRSESRGGNGQLRSDQLPLVTRCPLWVISGHMQCKKSCPLYPESGHVRCTRRCPLCAKSGHAPLRWITSSARPTARVARRDQATWPFFRLIAKSYLVGVCTGRSAGFSPLKVRTRCNQPRAGIGRVYQAHKKSVRHYGRSSCKSRPRAVDASLQGQ